METTIAERILMYILGSTVGAAVGFTVRGIGENVLSDYTAQIIVALCIVIGLIVSVALTEYRAERALKKNTQIRNETVALITHEMRTGLTSTGWAIDLVLSKYSKMLEPDDARMLSNVVKSIHTTVMHSVNLLDVSLLDIGKLAIAREWVKLSEVKTMVQELIERATLGAHKYAITLSSSVEVNAEREAEIDMLRIKIILENLVENAIQYTRGSVRTIHVDVHSTENDLVMSVKDSGIGIPADEQSKIFSEFYRAQNARKELASGSGIGLYLCAEYVRAHHGTIRFESQVNHGTTFFVTIPLKTRADVEEFLKKV